jgi:carbon monoxide dehydrogenase subunit G
MPTVTRTFTVAPPPQVVLTYLADFANAEEWDPGTESCTRIDDGPVAVGATWRNVSSIAGISTELTYTLEQLTQDTAVLVGRNDTATSTETITVRPVGDGGNRTELTYRNDLELHGAAKLASPAAKLVFEKLGNDTDKQLSQALADLV